MDLKDIMSVSGQSGLFKFVSQGRNGIIVESFADKKRSFINATSKVSFPGGYCIFTSEEEVPLNRFLRIFMKRKTVAPLRNPNHPEELKAFMEKILPTYDQERVYLSDIRKLVSWYNTLLSLNMLVFDEKIPAEASPEQGDKTPEAKAEEPAVKKPKSQLNRSNPLP